MSAGVFGASSTLPQGHEFASTVCTTQHGPEAVMTRLNRRYAGHVILETMTLEAQADGKTK